MEATGGWVSVSCGSWYQPCLLWALGKRGSDGPECPLGLLLRMALLFSVPSMTLAAGSLLRVFKGSMASPI